MATVATLLVVLVAAIHVYIVVLEMVLWRTPRGMRAFGAGYKATFAVALQTS